MDDMKIRKDVIDELEFLPSLEAANIGVAVSGGVVTLSGHVSSYAEKLCAERAACQVKGVRAIAQEIEVRYPNEKKTADDEIAKRVLSILHWDTLVPDEKIKVTVQKGWITLSGEVNWQYQRQAAAAAVRNLSGVLGVINDIALKPTVQASNVKTKIEDALARHAKIEAKAIRVDIRSGNQVLLEGKVDNWDERRAVEDAAWSVPGVTYVDDRLTISR